MDTESVVYIVDDDPSVRKSLSWLLESANHQTLSFESAKEFLGAYDPNRPGCLLLDVRMPESSGLQLQSTLDERDVDVPIIFISGHVDVRLASEAFRAGACDVLTKPVDVDVLLERVGEALEKDKENRVKRSTVEAKVRQLGKLTPKEGEVFQEMMKGRTIKQLASHFNITFQTAAKHRARVLDKLNVETDAQLINSYQDCSATP
ncbi:MAG: response regulator [Planctomycetota bacterium]